MRTNSIGQSLAWLAIASAVSAQSVLNDLSFGHQGPISPNGRGIPGWSVNSENHQVQILSDKIILTPPIPGNARGTAWSDATASLTDWTAEIEFRASGQDTGSGNLNIWFVKDKGAVGSNSVYTVGNFDGLALVVDQYGGGGGKVRGFLNDGTTNYMAHSNPESLAFGHCDYSYRNLGRPSKVRISNQNGLSVSIDDKECFRTDQAALPAGYYFGLTAATSDNPDSFEINKFVVSSGGQSAPQQDSQPAASRDQPPSLQKLDRFPGSPESVPDKAADEIRGQEDQFADLHNRLQGMTHQTANLFAEFDSISRKIDEMQGKIMGAMPSVPHNDIADLKRRVEGIERTVQQIQRDVEGRDYRQHMNDLQMAVDNIKGGLTEHLPDTMRGIISSSMPRMGMFLFAVLGVQITLALAYIIYKRRRNSMPKKYL